VRQRLVQLGDVFPRGGPEPLAWRPEVPLWPRLKREFAGVYQSDDGRFRVERSSAGWMRVPSSEESGAPGAEPGTRV